MSKPILLIPPVIAIGLSAFWLGSQQQSMSSLDQQSAALQKAIAARSSGTLADSSSAKPASNSSTAKDKEPLDWKKIAAQFAVMQTSGGMGDMRTMMKFQLRLQDTSKEELVAALDEIAALDLPRESRDMLEQLLIGPLAQKDPEFALTKFIDRIQDNSSMSWQLANAL